MQNVDREGTFEARVTHAEMYNADSGAIAVKLEFAVVRQYDKASKTYTDWPEGYGFPGDVWLVKKTGETMPDNIKRLSRTFGWDGHPNNVGQMIGGLCKCDVKADTYNGVTTYKAAFINPAGEMDLSEISDKYAATFMAYAAEVGPITPAPAPVTPPPAAPAIPPPPASDEVPF